MSGYSGLDWFEIAFNLSVCAWLFLSWRDMKRRIGALEAAAVHP